MQQYQFPFELNSVTRAYFERLSTIETGDTAADLKAITQLDPNPEAIARLSKNPEWNSMMHTTCVATRLQAGHANNALPQMAQANINCRILPGYSLEESASSSSNLRRPESYGPLRKRCRRGLRRGSRPQQLPPPPLNPQVMAASKS